MDPAKTAAVSRPTRSSASRKPGSIRRGDGHAVHHWKPAEEWFVDLTWTREMGLSLAYVATGLNNERKAAAEQEFG